MGNTDLNLYFGRNSAFFSKITPETFLKNKYCVIESLTSLPMQQKLDNPLHFTSTARFLSKGLSILYDFLT